MATSDTSLAEEIRECPVCFEDMIDKDPKLLACKHSFCLPCLSKIAETDGTSSLTVPCPKCRHDTVVKSGKLSDLPDNFFLQEIKEILAERTRHNYCFYCNRGDKETKAVSLCTNCHRYMCTECSENHRKNPIFKKHDIMSLADETQDYCSKHSEPVMYVCRACSPLRYLCDVCVTLDEPCHATVNWKEISRKGEAARNIGQTKTGCTGDKGRRFTNVYIKNLSKEIADDELKDMFKLYGGVTSAEVMTDYNGRSKGFGFVNFFDPRAASRAVEEMNGTEVKGKTLYVGRAQTAAERHAELKAKFGPESPKPCHPCVNLYVKNLDDNIDDARLRKEFLQFGTITSAKVMCDSLGRSKGFGFVCFSKPEEAATAVTKMNGRVIVSKQLYVALAQRKEDRKAHLASQYMQRLASMRMQPVGQVFQPGGTGYFTPMMPRAAKGSYFAPTQMAQMRATPRWNPQQQVRPAPQAAAGFQTMPGSAQMRQPSPKQQPIRAAVNARPLTGVAAGQVGRPNTGAVPSGAQLRPSFTYTPAIHSPPPKAAMSNQVSQQIEEAVTDLEELKTTEKARDTHS